MPATALQPGDTKTRFGAHQTHFITAIDVDRTSLAHIQAEMHITDEGMNNVNSGFLSLATGLAVAGELGITEMLKMPKDDETAICIGVSRRYDRENSMGIYTYTYEGLLADATLYLEQELEFAMNQEPIETHPSFEVFEPIYGPYDPINRTWQRVPTAKQAQAGGLGGPNQLTQKVTNPMFGTTSYLSPGAVFRISYCDTEITGDTLDGIGTISSPPLNEFQEFEQWVDKSGRNWLKLAPKIRKRGGAFQVTMEWLLSGPRGWMKDLYTEEALSHNAGDKGGESPGAPENWGPSSPFTGGPGPIF